MPVPFFDALLVLGLMIGGGPGADRVSSQDGRIVLEDSSGHTSALTQTGFDSDPWLSPGGQTVVFLRHSAEDPFRTSVYEIDLRTRTPRLLFSGPAKYAGRASSYFGRPELSESRDILFLLAKEYATEGSLIAIELATGQARLISDQVVGYDIIACPTHRGDLIALKRHEDILGRPYHLYWLYSPSGDELGLAGADELNVDVLREGDCGDPGQLPSASSPALSPAENDATRVDGSVMERRLVTRIEPEYPIQAVSDHIQGDVTLLVRVASDGTVQNASLVSGPPQLAEAAITAVKQWKYRPAEPSGNRGPVVTVVKVPFRLPSTSR